MGKKIILIFIMLAFLVLPANGFSMEDNSTDIAEAAELPVVGTYECLKELLAEVQRNNPLPEIRFRNAATGGKAAADLAAVEAQAGYSGTNVQVEGVDEADLVKTDGEYIYLVKGQEVLIVKANPPEKMELVNKVSFAEGFNPRELYIDENHLVVIGSREYKKNDKEQPAEAIRNISEPYGAESITKALIYNLSSTSDPRLLREVELEGDYVTSRKIGTALYFIANKYLDYALTPSYRDTAKGNGFISLGYEEIRYFPDFLTPNYLLLAGLNLAEPKEEVHISAFLGAGEDVYASEQNLYVTLGAYERIKPLPGEPAAAVGRLPVFIQNTNVYKFALKSGQVSYQGRGEVPGRILNQFSMDEYGGNFRIVTTKDAVRRTAEDTSANNVYILDAGMDIIGRLEGMAPGERVYSVRFMGERAYVVTFKDVDPLFVIDLKDPARPEILGALKIPGYSDYLHPYDENHLIGFGKDTVEVSQKDWQGQELGTISYYQGLKIALFDVTDVQNPLEKHKIVIGDRGTDSELLRNHKALLFSKEKELFAFPATVMEKRGQGQEASGYGEFTFQGAYVYRLNPQEGFQLKGRITHLAGEDYKKAGQGWYDSPKNITRLLYIGDTLYTLSGDRIMSHDVQTLREISRVTLP